MQGQEPVLLYPLFRLDYDVIYNTEVRSKQVNVGKMEKRQPSRIITFDREAKKGIVVDTGIDES